MNRRLALLLAALLLPPGPLARSSASPDDLAVLSDEFDDARSLARWTRHDVAEGWPSQWKKLDVNTTSPGMLHVEPHASAWFDGMRGPFLHREVPGDFVVTARVRASGRRADVPEVGWSLLGLMVRAPRPGVTPATWEPGGEHWLFLTTGSADDVGRPQIEDKTTVRGRSRLRTRPAKAGWVELRVARVGSAFVLLRRFEGEGWAVHQRFSRPDLPAVLQVGVTAYSDGDTASGQIAAGTLATLDYNRTVDTAGNPDLVGRVDWVRFRRPAVPDALRDRDLTSFGVSDAALLAFLGD